MRKENGVNADAINNAVSKDPVSAKNVCEETENLKEIYITDLKVDKIWKNSILWLKTITPACILSSIQLVVEDSKGNATLLYLYNQVENGASLAEV